MFDVLVIGAGLGGMTVALRLAAGGRRVGLLAKKGFEESSSCRAQGGIAAAIGVDDSPALHVADTLTAGGGLCHRDTVERVAERGPACIRWLEEQGVRFTRTDDDSALHLTREGGHSRRRVVHAADASGRAIVAALSARVAAAANITVLDEQLAVDLITAAKLGSPAANRCLGAYALDRHSGAVVTHRARAVVLATGGASKIYLYTTNPDTSTGDGIAMAWRAGCRVANLEFVQFHPTCLYHPLAKSLLISEALRGEGGLPAAARRAPLHARPRCTRRTGPARHRGPRHRLRNEARRLRLRVPRHQPQAGRRDPGHISQHRRSLPGVRHRHHPAAAFRWSRPPITAAAASSPTSMRATDLPGLLRGGRMHLHRACTAPTGWPAIRCWSALVFGASVAQRIWSRTCRHSDRRTGALPAWDESRVTDPDEQVVVSHNWDELRRFMWDYVGIVRTNKRLERARHRVDLLQEEIADFYGNFRVTNDLIELRNLALVAELTIRSAQARHESRGLHFNRDYPATLPDSQASDTILAPADCL